ncbi:putative integral inner membrane protein [Carnobacterium maltaromaticum]|uniref:DUF817 domain-containing protein n=1 Tax=Carnobacterium maltaromaticum TaxID=2751 RepID=UPI00191B9DFF|nr:DUF817 domain-containing protein [Carnobacterium maltaromaticum]CAD5897764.1 putative integral inner membrane protein [Carnobacterium maltaromaticum]
MSFIRGLLQFTYQQVLCCLFPGAIFLALIVTKYFSIPGIARYDLLLFICILIQVLLLYFKLETVDELKVIMLFHVIGLVLEIYKVNIGSWSYPGAGFWKLGGVPLYSGFMYSSIGSYICKAWKVFDLQLINWPNQKLVITLSLAIYANFFTHHFIWDFRWILILLVFILFYRTWVYFTVGGKVLKMPMSFSFFCIAFFIWVAENIASFFGAWAYPDQLARWQLVHIGKITSWYLLIIISIMIVAELKLKKTSQLFNESTEIKSNK